MNNTCTPAERINTQFPHWVMGIHHFRGEDTVLLRREGLLDVCRFLRENVAMCFDFLMDLTAVDLSTMGTQALGETFRPIPVVDPSIAWVDFTDEQEEPQGPHNVYGEHSPRFEVVYHLFSPQHKHRIRLKVPVEASDPCVESVTSVWKGANWFEREVWDLFGIIFKHHPNLKRILLYEGFQGHPLRKDYPVNKRQPLIGPIN